MKAKLILGILIPLIIVLVLSILSTTNKGFSISSETKPEVMFNSLFLNQTYTYSEKDNIQIQTLTLNNNFFMPRRFELPRMLACLNDNENVKEKKSLQLRNSEGSYPKDPITDEILFSYSDSRESVEVAANSQKRVKVLVEPLYIENFDKNIASYKDYDELLLVESKEKRRDYYTPCLSLTDEELINAIHINILK